MNESVGSEEDAEEFHKATLALEEIAGQTEAERGDRDVTHFVVPEGQRIIEPLKGPHHTLVK